MVEAVQFVVSMPGGAEALVHTRETIEAAVRSDPAHGVWACVDVDFQNAFPSLRHEAIDTATGARVPELQPWSRWCQDNCGIVFLRSGAKYRARRGAEQGDPLASMQCGCVIADVVALALADMKAQKPHGEDLACWRLCAAVLSRKLQEYQEARKDRIRSLRGSSQSCAGSLTANCCTGKRSA